MLIEIEDPQKATSRFQYPIIFAAGFRVFFLSTGIYACFSLLIWLLLHHGVWEIPLSYPPFLWHGHEMVFGFATAGLAGFLLTAVPNWTGAKHIIGPHLILLSGTWLLGRIAFIFAGILSPYIVLFCDLLFLPFFALAVFTPILQLKQTRNYIFFPILGIAWLGNLAFHLEAIGLVQYGLLGIQSGIYVLIGLIAIVGGRVIPSFTATFVRMQGRYGETTSYKLIEYAAFPVIVLALLSEIFLPYHWLGGIIFLFAAIVHAIRLSGWKTIEALKSPLLWVLHAGYFWLVFGLLLRGLACFLDFSPFAAHHALTIGATGMLLLGMMTRASLGHSGRSLNPPKLAVIGYGLIGFAALVRVMVQIFLPQLHYGMGVGLSGLLWILGFLAFTISYWDILAKPRIDGRPG